MTLELMYGNADGCRNYYMVLDGKSHPLNDIPKVGTFYDMRSAREKANEILRKEVSDLSVLIPLQQLVLIKKFNWDGIL